MENWKQKQENVIKRGEDLFFFFFCFSLLKTMKICFGATKMGIFYREKVFHAGKKIRKNYGKSKLQVPDTGMSQYWSILEHFWCTSIARKCDPYVL